MLAILGCDCHNGLTLSQHLLEREGVSDWLSVPAFRGKTKCRKFLQEFGDAENSDGVLLSKFLDEASSFSVILGYDDTHAIWVNVGHGDIRSKTEAKHIIKLFA